MNFVPDPFFASFYPFPISAQNSFPIESHGYANQVDYNTVLNGYNQNQGNDFSGISQVQDLAAGGLFPLNLSLAASSAESIKECSVCHQLKPKLVCSYNVNSANLPCVLEALGMTQEEFFDRNYPNQTEWPLCQTCWNSVRRTGKSRGKKRVQRDESSQFGSWEISDLQTEIRFLRAAIQSKQEQMESLKSDIESVSETLGLMEQAMKEKMANDPDNRNSPGNVSSTSSDSSAPSLVRDYYISDHLLTMENVDACNSYFYEHGRSEGVNDVSRTGKSKIRCEFKIESFSFQVLGLLKRRKHFSVVSLKQTQIVVVTVCGESLPKSLMAEQEDRRDSSTLISFCVVRSLTSVTTRRHQKQRSFRPDVNQVKK